MGRVATDEVEAAATAELLSIVVVEFDAIEGEAATPPPPFNHASNLSLSSVREAADGECWGTRLSSFDGDEPLLLLCFVSSSPVSSIIAVALGACGSSIHKLYNSKKAATTEESSSQKKLDQQPGNPHQERILLLRSYCLVLPVCEVSACWPAWWLQQRMSNRSSFQNWIR